MLRVKGGEVRVNAMASPYYPGERRAPLAQAAEPVQNVVVMDPTLTTVEVRPASSSG